VANERVATEHPNATVVRNLYDAFARRDRDLVCSLIAEDCRWIIPGRGSQAGTYEGRDAVIELFRSITKLTEGSATFDLDAVIAADEYAVVLQRGHGTVDGRSADLDECLVYRIEDGRVVEMKEFQFDLYTFEEWWNPGMAS
jgi:ketosteroid isomerase-like protein